MKVYVSAFSVWEAKYVANYLRANGHTVASSWHESEERPATDEGWTGLLKKRNRPEIAEADVLVLVASKNAVPGGKFVEAGIALGLGKPVVVLGERENRVLWDEGVTAVKSPQDIVQLLKSWRK